MRRSLFIALALGAMAFLSACGGGSSALTGKAWQLTAITEKVPAFQGVIPAEDQSKYEITFNSDGNFAATADCNVVGGTYKTTGSNGLTIAPGPSTMAFCGEESFDALFITALSRSETYAVAGDTLTINLEDGGILTLVAAAPASSTAASAAAASAKPTAAPTAKPSTAPTAKPSAAASSAPGASAAPSAGAGAGLVGKAWQLTAVTEKVPAFQGVVPAEQQANYTIEFAADGTFSAKADCNQLSGTYETADPAAASGDLTIVPGPMTMALCPDGSLGDLFVVGLGNAASYAVADGALTITLHDEGTLAFK